MADRIVVREDLPTHVEEVVILVGRGACSTFSGPPAPGNSRGNQVRSASWWMGFPWCSRMAPTGRGCRPFCPVSPMWPGLVPRTAASSACNSLHLETPYPHQRDPHPVARLRGHRGRSPAPKRLRQMADGEVHIAGQRWTFGDS